MGEIEVTKFSRVLKPIQKDRGSIRRAVLSPMVCAVLASLGIFGGISALFVGIVSVMIHGMVSGDTVFNQVGTGLLIVAIPMILVGSIFLDEIEPRHK